MRKVVIPTPWLVLILAVVLAADASAVRIKELCEIQGVRGNDLTGIGLVVGLAGTGDQGPLAVRAQQHLLERLNVEVASLGDLRSDNIAVVACDATIPAFAKEGTRIDVRVSSIGDSDSLEGGTLLATYLYGADGNVYAVAQGPLSVGGFNAQGGGGATSISQNHVTVGRIPMGAYVEREVPSTITDGHRIMLLMKRPDFTTAANIEHQLNNRVAPNCAAALGAGTISVIIPPEKRGSLVSFIAELQEISIETETPSRVVINERTGTLVVGGNVMIKPCQVAHGNLTIEIASTTQVVQPPPFSLGMTAEEEATSVEVRKDIGHLMPVEGTSASEVATALNKLKVTPRDMISIFQALREAGALEADLEIM